VLKEWCIVLARRADGTSGQGVAAAVLAGIGAAMGGCKDHRTGQTSIGEAIGKAEKGKRSCHFLMVLMMSG
jgi:hypothetical protein